ncbi:hypothetical protein QOZ80_8BG0658060 [Eleusine coracana subsp. coracana]|nr:hypothetical protein QOZ80_8BG0658060 [Eleusine coracana subsp. coracana]
MATTELCWLVLPAWISPGAALFVFFNILIGAIAVMSREQAGGGSASRRRLCRRASSMVLERLRSFSTFPFHQAALAEYSYHYHTSLEAADQEQVRNQLASHHPAAEALAVDVAASMPDPQEDEPESLENKSSSSDEANAQDQKEKHHTSESFSPSTPASNDDDATAAAERPGKKKPRNKVAAKICKRRVRASGREAEEWLVEGKAELNARAELFISQFRENLKLQRLNSFANYSRALHRGGSAAPEHNRSMPLSGY